MTAVLCCCVLGMLVEQVFVVLIQAGNEALLNVFPLVVLVKFERVGERFVGQLLFLVGRSLGMLDYLNVILIVDVSATELALWHTIITLLLKQLARSRQINRIL